MGVIALTLIVGALLVLTGFAFINGMERNWLDLVAGTMVGDVGVTAADVTKLSVFATEPVLKAAEGSGVASATERVEFDGILAKGDASAPATVRGIDVKREARLLQILRNAADDLLGLDGSGGQYSVAISKRMAADLAVAVGDTVELSGARLGGELFREKAVVAYVFEGNVKNAALDLWVLLPLKDARRMLGAGDGEATSVRVFLKEPTPEAFDTVTQALNGAARGKDLTVQPWDETDEATWMTSVYIWKGVLFFFLAMLSVLIIIGAFGVISATVLERTREVGTMRALGMTPVQVFATLLSELFLVGLFASLVAIGLSWLLLAATREGVLASTEALALSFGGKRLYPDLSARVLGLGLLFTTLLAVVSGVGPILRVSLIKEIDALRHV